MCPICLTSLAITVATTVGGFAATTALALRVKRAWIQDEEAEPRARKCCEKHDPNRRA